jgi:hypothetical protein
MRSRPVIVSALSAALAPVLCATLAAAPAAAGGRGRAAREERREQREDRREDRRDEARENRDDRRDGATPGANKRQRRQGSRIVGGVRSGQLTKAEVDGLAAREKALRDLEGSMKADGAMTPDERKKLHDELDALSRAIRSEKHDADRSAPLRLRDGNDDKAAAGRGRRLGEVRRELNRTDLPPEQRAALEAEHTRLVDELYEEALDG